MSIFTYHLVEALTGHAQPQEGAKEVLVSDVSNRIILVIVLLAASACSISTSPTPIPPDKLDIVTVQNEIITRLNAERAARWVGEVKGNDVLHELAEQRALDIVEGRIDFGLVDNALADQLDQPIAELRILLCGGSFTSAIVAEEAMKQWAGTPELDKAMMGNWALAGAGFAIGCPVEAKAEGIALVVLLAGKSPFSGG